MAKKTESANYTVTVAEISGEMTVKQKLQMTDTKSAIQLVQATKETPILIKPKAWAVLDIHNEKSPDVDYKNYVVVDDDGKVYVTGSQEFWNTFRYIVDGMAESDEDYAVQVSQKPSKNYSGKVFLSCSLV